MYALAAPLWVVGVPALIAVVLVTRWWQPLAVLVWLGVVVVRDSGAPPVPGRLLRPDEEPELASLVRTCAERCGFDALLTVRVLPVPDAVLARTRIGGRAGYVLGLGWPFIRILPAAQLAAVVAHELAHSEIENVRRAEWLVGGRNALAMSLDNMVHVPRRLARRLLEATTPTAWSIELAADTAGARAVGGLAACEAIEATSWCSNAFDMAAHLWLEAMLEAGEYPVDFYAALDEALRDPYVRRRLESELAFDELLHGPDESHPTTALRVAAMAAGAASSPFGVEPVLIRSREALDAWCIEQLLPFKDGTPRPMKVREADLDAYRTQDRPTRELLSAATLAVLNDASWAAGLDALRDERHWRALAEIVEPEIEHVPPSVRPAAQRLGMVGCLTSLLTDVLMQAGWARATRWVATVRVAPDGSVVDVMELAERAVDSGDSAPLTALLDSASPGWADRS